jgi:hypothetical protein
MQNNHRPFNTTIMKSILPFSSNTKWINILFVSINLLMGLLIVVLVILISLKKDSNGFTELYFQGELPKMIGLNTHNRFNFIIHNIENKDTQYNYEVLIDSSPILQGKTDLMHNEKTIIDCDFILKERPERNPFVISVELNNDQEIHFWAHLE